MRANFKWKNEFFNFFFIFYFKFEFMYGNFHCTNIFVVCENAKTTKNHENKKKETRSIFYNENNGQHILLTWLHNAASYSCFGQKGLSF